MLCVAYETLARRSELVALEIDDLDLHPDGTSQALPGWALRRTWQLSISILRQ
jgi:integrase